MKAEDIVLGQTYRIRQWEDMEKEHGLDTIDLYDEGNHISGPDDVWFHAKMRPLCGKLYTPTSWRLECGACNPTIDEGSIYPWMLESAFSDDPEDTLP